MQEASLKHTFPVLLVCGVLAPLAFALIAELLCDHCRWCLLGICSMLLHMLQYFLDVFLYNCSTPLKSRHCVLALHDLQELHATPFHGMRKEWHCFWKQGTTIGFFLFFSAPTPQIAIFSAVFFVQLRRMQVAQSVSAKETDHFWCARSEMLQRIQNT